MLKEIVIRLRFYHWNIKTSIVRLCLPVLLAVCWLAPSVAKADGFPSGWAHRVPITINHDQIDENLAYFTLVLTEEMSAVLSSVDGPLDADGLRPSIDGGGDVRFSADEAGAQRLAVDVREWVTDNDPASGSLEVAVKVPSISSSTDTTIYLWWGEAGETQPAPGDPFGQFAAYDAFTDFVSPDGGDNRTSTPLLAVPHGVTIGGVAGPNGLGATAFDQTGGIVFTAPGGGVPSFGYDRDDPFTINALVWRGPSMFSSPGGGAAFAHMDADNGFRGFDLFSNANANATEIVATHKISTWPDDARKSEHNGTVPQEVWQAISASDLGGPGGFDRTRLYVDGDPVPAVDATLNETLSSTDTTPNTWPAIGGRYSSSGNWMNVWSGRISEIQVSSAVREEAWHKAWHDNRLTPASLLSVGSIEDVSVEIVNGDGQTATVDTPVSTPPSVVVKGPNDNPIAGVEVTFAVTSGNGSVSGATATSDGSGIATVGSWTLGPTAGPNTLTASAAGLDDVTFTATGVSVPAAPTNVVATAGDAQATVSWTAPVDDGGLEITGYTVTSSPDGLSCTTTGATTCTVTGLTNGTAYSFTVIATNGVGDSVPSTASDLVTPVGPPGSPMEVHAEPVERGLRVSWLAPLDDGGSPILSYRAQVNPSCEVPALANEIPGETAYSCTIGNLDPEQDYVATVNAINAAGEGLGTAADGGESTQPLPVMPIPTLGIWGVMILMLLMVALPVLVRRAGASEPR